MFVIKAINQDGKEMYYDYDSRYGTGPYWTHSIFNAKIFGSVESAQKCLEVSDFEHPDTYSDGRIEPPRMIRLGAFYGANKTTGCSLTIRICEIHLSPVTSVTYKAEIKVPKGVIYEY